MNCADCRQKREKKTKAIKKFLYERVVSLRYGCMCNANRKYWKLKDIATALDLPIMTVSDICKRFRRENCQMDRMDLRVNNGARLKLTRE